ncbi:unnamed protein product [Brassica rapa subsp. trilocularis]
MSRVWELGKIRSFFFLRLVRDRELSCDFSSSSSSILLSHLRFLFLVFDSSSSSSFFFGSPSIPLILLRFLRLSMARNKLLWLWVDSSLA